MRAGEVICCFGCLPVPTFPIIAGNRLTSFSIPIFTPLSFGPQIPVARMRGED